MILLGTVLLEPNRWKNSDQPKIFASGWAARAADAGFDGLELWENHWLRADALEREALVSAPLPVHVFNTYARFDSPDAAPAISSMVSAVRTLRAKAVKFNVGPPPGDPESAMSLILEASRSLPAAMRLRCECHQGTWLETPEAAARFFQDLPIPVDVIVHAFALSPEELKRWFSILGPRITCIHVQCRDEEGRWSGIARHPERSCQTLQALEGCGFQGDFTLEFTAGTGSDADLPDQLWSSALKDLEWLRTAGVSRFVGSLKE